jgi:exodeoxyribonuclease V gamma subunit
MYVHRSNRMEVLVDELARVLRVPKLAPLASETIVVQSRGMERWLARELSLRLGSFSRARFPFPRAFIQEAMDAVLGPQEGAARFERGALTWSIVSLLGELRAERGFATVSSYLSDDPDGRRRVQLAQRIAHLFDQYSVYRPSMVLEWEAGKGSDWQAILWRALTARLGSSHFAARSRDFERSFSPLFVARGSLPPRICIVGGASLPPLFLRLLGKIAEAVEVHLFALSPSSEYFAEGAADAVALAGGGVHPLLASLGSVGAALQQSLETEMSYVEGAGSFVDPGTDTLLHALQSDLLHNHVRGSESTPFLEPRADDGSISIVSCHSPMREVEVLRDRLLATFQADPTLRPDDVVVMAPHIEEYAPLVAAVFEADPKSAHYIPHRIADRNERRVNVAASALLGVLAVLRGRFKASEVLDLLQAEPIRERFGIAAADLPRIHRWVNDAGIRWGQDEAHRAEFGLPRDERNTWTFGLRRLLLGYALSDDGRTNFEGCVPHDDVTGDGALLLGKLNELCETLFGFRREVQRSYSLAEWRDLLGRMTSALLAEGETWQLRPLHEGLYQLALQAETATFTEPVSLEVMTQLLAEHFESEIYGGEFLSGGVTFCAMLPLRSIPFRVVCLLGMSDGEFPRVETHLGFDKMAERPRVGDRSVRADDRYLFLETLLSARDKLQISYVGRGIQDNEARPPAVVVSELTTAVRGMFADASSKCLAPAEQPLQPWSPRHFDGRDEQLASFDAEHARGAAALAGTLQAEAVFCAQPLERPEVADTVDLDDLVRFFQSPARALLRSLGVRIEDDAELVVDREPVESDALERYQVGARLLSGEWEVLSGPSAGAELRKHLEETELRRGLLPIGAPGRVSVQAIVDLALEIRAAARRYTKAGKGPAQVFELGLGAALDAGGAAALVGALDRVYGRTQIECMYSQLGARHEVAAWVRHLAARAAGLPVDDAVLVGRDDKNPVCVRRFVPLDAGRAKELLVDLVGVYRLGHRVPLPLFPNASRQYVRTLLKKADDDAPGRALNAARFEFTKMFGEAHDAYVKLAFRGQDVIADGASTGVAGAPELGFAELSRRVFEPLLRHQEELDPQGHSEPMRKHRA